MSHQETAQFGRSARDLLGGSRAAVVDLLAEAALVRPRPTDISRELGLDKTLAWKVARFISEPDPFAAARHLPGSGGIEILVKAAVARGVSALQAARVRDADEALRGFMKAHAGDRASFEAMLAAHAVHGRDDLEQRRAYYRAGSAIWGARARLQMLTLLLRPSDTVDGMIDVVQLGGLYDLERLRSDVPWIVRRLRAGNDSERERYTLDREALDPDGLSADHPLALMPAYCSRPLPRLREFIGANGWLCAEVVPGSIGRDGAVTCVTGEIHRAVLPSRRAEENTAGRYSLSVRTPVEAVVFDLLLHRDLAHFGDAELHIFGQLEDRPHAGGAAPHAVAMYPSEPARSLGAPPIVQSALESTHAPLLRDALDLAGWGELGNFRGYRAELEFPPAPCDLTLICEIGAGG